MSLDPTASPWPGVVASVAVCLWIAAIGVPLAHAVFRNRPRLVWPYYAPIVGIVAVLLVTNLAAYAMPGAPAAWFGLLASSALAAVAVWRRGAPRALPRGSRFALPGLALAAVGIFVLAYANRLHGDMPDYTWHYPLALQLANGVFPPVTPYGVDAGPGYHYGHALLAASVISTAGVLPWTAFDALTSFLVVALVLAVAGFAYDVGAPLPLALGLGAALGFFGGGVFLGYRAGYVENMAFLDPPARLAGAFTWIGRPQWALALGFVVLVAAAFEAGKARRQALLLAAGAGVLALAEAAVMLLASAALALVGTARVVRLPGRDRAFLAGALLASALLILFAGGPISDALMGRGGTTGMVRAAWEPSAQELQPFEQGGSGLVRVGVIPLVAVATLAAYRRRSWGLGFLAAAGAFGLLEAQLLHSPVERNNERTFTLVQAVAMIGALAGAGALVGALRGKSRRRLATAVVVLLILVPSGLPRAVSGTHLALGDLEVVNPALDDSGHHYLDRVFFGEHLAANWEIYAWLARSLPRDARLLSPESFVSASAAGVASPRSGRNLQVYSSWNSTWVYHDALRFLQRDDLTDMGITHVHVTDAMAANLDPFAKRLLADPGHFRLLTDIYTDAGARHRVFQVMPGAGVTEVAASSYRALRQLVPPNAPVATLGSLPFAERLFVLSAFAEHADLGALYHTYFDRGTRVPQVETLTDRPDSGVVILREPLEPTTLSVSRDEALWGGHGIRVYDLAATWSPVWRIGHDSAALPGPQRALCESVDGQVALRLLGEPGTTVTAGSTVVTLTGLPQVILVAVPDCGALTLRADSGVAPFAQIRPHHQGRPVDLDAPIAGLGFDGGVVGQHAIVNLWYRNPDAVLFVTGTEFRLYEADPLGVGLSASIPNPRTASLRWWPGPLALYAPKQTARIEFDARRLEINGDSGGGSASQLTPGRTYLLALTVAGVDPRYGYVEIQHIVPLARVVLSEAGVYYEVLSGIVTIEHHAPGTRR